jgi:MFS transporter, PPP family, 3-phenylpropionic acid transporter
MSPAARLRLFYFFYYGAVGANLPYFTAYLRGLGFSGAEIGTAQMLGPAVAGPAALAWAVVADRLHAPARTLRLASLCAFAVMAVLPLARSPVAVALVLLGNGLFASASVPLVDAVTMEWVRGQPGLSYARIRLFGSIGFITVALALGFGLDARGGRAADLAVPITVALCVAGYAAAARSLPAVPPLEARPGLVDLAALLRDRRLLAVLLGCAVHWAACAPFHLLFGVYVRDSSFPASVTGLAMFAAVGAEVLALFAYPRLERRLGVRPLFVISFAGTALRWTLLWRAHGAAAVISLQLLHALTFGLFWGAAVATMARMVPPRLRATGQALFSAVVFGGGNAVGYWLSGMGYDAFGGVRPLYAFSAVAEGALLVTLLIGGRLVDARRRG